jgi:hypothetical protein
MKYEDWVALIEELCDCERCETHRTVFGGGTEPCMCQQCKDHTKFKDKWPELT